VLREVDIVLPRPHAKQREIIESPAKRKVVIYGRRAGKTVTASDLASRRFLAGRRVLYAAPVDDQTTAMWDACQAYFSDAIAAGLIYRNQTKRLLEGRVAGWGRIRCKTAWDADTMRGDKADDLILDEWAYMRPNAWSLVGAPMLLDTDGDAYFLTTPNRKNHAFAMYVRALGDTTGRWAAFHATSHDNPHLSAAALAEIVGDLTPDAYRQEVMAEFLDNEGAVFRNIAASLYPGGDTPEMHAAHWIVAGQDWGKQDDYSACSVVCATCRRELELVRFRGESYRMQRARLAVVWARWGVKHIEAESNAMGDPVIEDLQSEGWPVVPFATTAQSKPPLIESLALAFERAEIQWLDISIATAEAEAYEGKASPATGRMSYSAPEGVHDDTVIARALANRAVQLGTLQVGRMYD